MLLPFALASAFAGPVGAWGLNTSGQASLPLALTNAVAISAGYSHSLALRADGTALTWGANSYGQTNTPPGLTQVVGIAAGWYHNLALKPDGTVAAWGWNSGGQTNVPAGLYNVVGIAAGASHSLALKADGTVVAWGASSYGQTNVPAGLAGVVAVAAGGSHCLALKADGTVAAWGLNANGQASVPSGMSNVVSVAAGGAHSLALTADGTVAAWGVDNSGQTDVPAGLSNVVAIAAGLSNSLALKADGTVIGWGLNANGQAVAPPGLTNVSALAAGAYHDLILYGGNPAPFLMAPLPSRMVGLGSNALFYGAASGAWPLTYQWEFDGTNLAGATEPVLVVTNAQPSAAGAYTLVVSNAFGTVSSAAATLGLGLPPAITLQPQGQILALGGSTVLTVTATGTQPLTYQWQLYGTNVANNRIITVAGNGTNGFSGDGGPATNASLSGVASSIMDPAGNLLIADFDNNRVRKVDTNGIITTVVGTGGYGSAGDGGPATNATLFPHALALDAAGNLFIGDEAGNRIRKVDTNGVIWTVAGGGNSASFGDGGPATNAIFNYPSGLALDPAGNLYIADFSDNRVRKVDTNGIITTVAGNGGYGIRGYSGDGGPATNAMLNGPHRVALDASGNLFIADEYNNCVRKVDTNGIISTMPRTAPLGPSLSWPHGVSLDAAGDLFVANYGGNSIFKIDPRGVPSVVAGGVGGALGDGGPATSATLNGPDDATVCANGCLYIADQNNNRIREVFMGPRLLVDILAATNAGNYAVMVSNPYGSVTSSIAAVILAFPPAVALLQPQNQTVLAGANMSLGVAVSGVGPFNCQWQFNGASVLGFTGLNLALTNVSTADSGMYSLVVTSPYAAITNPVARLTVLPALVPPTITDQPLNVAGMPGGTVTLSAGVSGTGPLRYQWQLNGTNLPALIMTVAGGSVLSGVPATNASLSSPSGAAADTAGNLYIADTGNNRIRKVDPTGIISTWAGNGSPGYWGDGGAATNAGLSAPCAAAMDTAGNLFIADFNNHRIRKVDPNGLISTWAGNGSPGYLGDGGPATNASLYYPSGVAVDVIGNVFIADYRNFCIREVATNGVITTVAGNGSSSFSGDGGPATNAGVYYPNSVAVDLGGNVFISDSSSRIRKVDTNGIITTFAGNGGAGYSGDGGAATNATLYYPNGVAVDPFGNVFIEDTDNQRIRKVDTNGVITTVAGDGTAGYSGDGGVATNASLSSPDGLVADDFGNVFIADYGNNRVRRVDANGTITTVAGNGSTGSPGDGGGAAYGELNRPSGVALDGVGNLFIADMNNNRIRSVDTNGVIQTVAGNGTAGYSGDGGSASAADLGYPAGVAVDAMGTFFVADTVNHRVREVQVNGLITTLAGTGVPRYYGDNITIGPNACLNSPAAVAADAYGSQYIADTYNHRIRRVSPNGLISTVAGNGTGAFAGDSGAATNASLRYPRGVTLDALGNLFIADSSNNRIRKVGTNGIISTVAGNGSVGYSGDGVRATNASLNSPYGVAVDSTGNLFIADSANNRIRQVDTNGVLWTVAGVGLPGFSGDGGAATNAALNGPEGVTLDPSGNLLVADATNNRVREVFLAGSPTLVLTGLTTNQAGIYSVIVTSPYGCVTTTVATLTVGRASLPIINPGAFGLDPAGAFTLSFSGASNLTYTVLTSTNLMDWTVLGTASQVSPGQFQFADPGASNQGARFYRIRSP